MVVATWRRPGDLLRCLAAIDAQTRAAEDVVVVVRADDAPTWAALTTVRLSQAVLRTVSVEALGVVAALNAGLDAASGAIVAITDDDAAPRPDWLARIHEHLRQRPDVGAVGGRDWIHPDPEPVPDGSPVVGRLLGYGRLVGNHHRGGGAAREVDVLKGANIALRRTAVAQIRPDERLRGPGVQMHWELDLCLALKRSGWRLIYDPAVAVDHHPAARFDDDRAIPPLGALADEVHNETYALLRWLPWRSKLIAFAYAILVGSRRAPGAVTALERWLRGDDRAGVGARLLTAQRARLAAVRSALGAQTAPAGHPAGHPAVTVVAHDVGTPGGMERQLWELCTGLLERGYRVTVIARRCELAAHPRLRWIRLRAPQRPFSLAYPAFFLLGSLAVHRHREGLLHTTGAVVANRADLSTVHFCHHGARAAVGTPQTSRPSLLYRANGAASSWMSRAAERFCFSPRRTRRLVTVSGGVARELERFFPRQDEVVVIPNGVDRARFAPDPHARAEARGQLGLAADDLVALFVGGDWDRKGLRFAIGGVAGARGWHLVVVGQGDEVRHRALASRCGADGRVHFVGGASEPARYYACADAFLLPSAYEAFPLVSLEAAAAGLPLLAGRVSGVEELIEEGRNGWFVARDATAITERLRVLGTDPALRIEMRAAARESSRRYAWGGVVDAYVKLYEMLAGAERAATRRTFPSP